MILIISSENDISTGHVIDWLKFKKINFIRVSEKDFLDVIEMEIHNSDNCIFRIKNHVFNLSEIISIWYRRDYLTIKKTIITPPLEFDFDEKLNYQLNDEKNELFNYFLKLIKKKSLNHQFENSLSKLDVLDTCKLYDINIPPSLVTTNKLSLIKFIEKEEKVITKNFSQGIFLSSENVSTSHITLEVTAKMINGLSHNFHPMLFQKLIEKAFELRIFYLDGEFYASAIFSQNDEKTKLDFRNYNMEKPNRTPPFDLPTEIKIKLKKLMSHFNLISGSIDMIISEAGEFVFLEVNPIGQFSQVSHPCNYNLESLMAKHLCNE
jgi:ATP-GRASP peptide maturase of grasp-with-spasm system